MNKHINPLLTSEMFSTLDCIFKKDAKNNESTKILHDIVNKYRTNFKDENVLCMNTILDVTNFTVPVFSKVMFNLDTPVDTLLLQGFSSMNRQEVEIFSSSIQLVTAVMIHDNENMLLLNNLYSNKVYQRGTLSYVQGHVEFPKDTSETLGKILWRNMIKELEEELGEITNYGDSPFYRLSEPTTAIYLPIAPSTNKHCCVLYELEVDDVKNFYCRETDKNSLVSVRMDQIHTQYNYLCPWVLQSLSEFMSVKRAYLQHLEKFYL